MRSRLDPMKKFVAMLRKHKNRIVAFIYTGGLTNAVGYGLNRIIKMVKNPASGFANVDAFKGLIYLTVGDLDIPAQFPTKFRTI